MEGKMNIALLDLSPVKSSVLLSLTAFPHQVLQPSKASAFTPKVLFCFPYTKILIAAVDWETRSEL
jgi:hypothetical protein